MECKTLLRIKYSQRKLLNDFVESALFLNWGAALSYQKSRVRVLVVASVSGPDCLHILCQVCSTSAFAFYECQLHEDCKSNTGSTDIGSQGSNC